MCLCQPLPAAPLWPDAGHGGISNIIEDMQLLSTEAEGVNEAIPEERRKALVNRAGRLGALLGLTDTRAGAPDCERRRRAGEAARPAACCWPAGWADVMPVAQG